jgi:hypothetical protein
VVGTPSQQGTFTFTVTESTQVGPPLQQTYSIAVGPPLPLTDTTGGSPPGAGTVDTIYSATFSASGGEAPYTWSLVSGQLPPGLELASSDPPAQIDNEAAGTPTTVGTYVFTMKVTDTLGDTASGPVSITIDPIPPLKISGTGSCCLSGTVGTTYPSTAFGASGGEMPYTWTVATGQLPPGLALRYPEPYGKREPPGDINLAGTPTKAGTFNFTIKVTDNFGDTAGQACSITIKA